jgi:PBP1b-binding outer membrane lipoprotein LpoB
MKLLWSVLAAAAVSSVCAQSSPAAVQAHVVIRNTNYTVEFAANDDLVIVARDLVDQLDLRPENRDINVRAVASELRAQTMGQGDSLLLREPALDLPVVVGNGSVRLVVYEGESASAAAEGFARRMDISPDAVPQLAAAIMRNAVTATDPGKPYLLFAMNVDLDDAELGQLRFFSDEVGFEAEAAARFIINSGLAQRTDAQELADALARSLSARVAALGPEASLAQANTRIAADAAAAASVASNTNSDAPQQLQNIAPGTPLQASFAVGGMAFDLEFPAGAVAEELAAQFCETSWGDLGPALAAELGSNTINQAQCGGVLAELLLAQLG